MQIDEPQLASGVSIDSDAVYQVYFHGPAYQVLESAWGGESDTAVGRLRANLPARIGRVQKLKEPSVVKAQFFTVVRHNNGGPGFDADAVDESGVRIRCFETCWSR